MLIFEAQMFWISSFDQLDFNQKQDRSVRGKGAQSVESHVCCLCVDFMFTLHKIC